jgi:ABC-type uncharacterized transport system substrate-binding protein
MWFAIKRLSLGVFLIALTSAVLLVADWHRRKPGVGRVPHAAVLIYSSQPVLLEGAQGMVEGLAENGFIDGRSIVFTRYNAEGDLATVNTIAKQVTDGHFDLVLTMSTPAMQAVANANKAGKVVHVFGVVADPFGAGVGINRENPLDHPRHLVGIGTSLPVARCFQLAREFFPDLKSVGVVWNPGESNSRVFTEQARKAAQELGIDLLETSADNSSAVVEAASSVISRGAQALWVGGDNTVLLALDSVIATARKARIPVFTITPGDPQRGTLFDQGANFHEIGRQTGELAAQILRGADPATIPVRNAAPEKLVINKLALNGLTDPWRLPEDALARADIFVDEAGVHAKAVATTPQLSAGRVFKVGIVYFAPEPGAESCMQGLLDGLRDLGFVEGKNLEVRKAHAQGEIANIPSVLQNYDNQDLDVIVPMTTPCLTAACSTVKKTPVVFTYVYDPIAAGAGTSFTDHLPNVTGVGSFPPVEETIDVIQRLVPGVRSVGTLYNNSEANSRKVVSVARELFRQRGMTLEEVAITSTSEVFQAAQALAQRSVQAVWISGDNTALQAFAGIVKVATDARLPLVNNDPEFVQQGALASVGIGWYQTGYAAAKVVARVLRGESPQTIPFENVAVRKTELNHEMARKLDVTFPAELIKEAEATAKPQASAKRETLAPLAKKWGVNLVEFNNVLDVEEAEHGVLTGLREAGLVEGRDYDIKIRNAQGDMGTVNSLIDAAVTDSADLLITLSTPTLQAALQRARGLPIVFTYVASGVIAGAGRSDEDHLPNVTGVYLGGGYAELLAIMREYFPSVHTVGTLFVPSEVNSVFHKDQLTEAARKVGIEVVAVAASTSAEVPDAALSLCSRKLDALCQIPGNLTAASFPSIAQAARRARLPIFAFQSSQARAGAAVVLARDYEDGGREAGLIAARVMRGESPASIPFQPLSKTRLIVNLEAARSSGLTLPTALIKRAEEVIGQ